MQFSLCFSVLVASFLTIEGHVRWVCPRPQSTNTGIKSGPCGAVDFEGGYMDVVPGPMTVRWEESIFHRGAPSSIRLMKKGDDSTACLLLDHIPHNDAMVVKFPFTDPNCKISGEPLGKCSGVTQVTVNIPDIDCPDCYLLLTSVMTDKYGPTTACSQLTNGNNNCSTYYTCTNIKIRPTAAGVGRDISTCTNYTQNLLGAWPFMMPNNVYYDEGHNYSPDGWLTGSQFQGATATYPAAIYNSGPCAAPSRTFGLSLSPSSSNSTARGLVSMVVTENRASLMGVVVGEQLGNIAAITLNGRPNGANTVNIPISMMKNGVLQGIIDVAQAAAFIDSGKFFTSMSVTFGNEILQGDVIDGVTQASLMTPSGTVGEAIFVPGSSDIQYEIVVMGPSSKPSAGLYGPARRGMTSTSSVDLTIGGSRIGTQGWHGKGTLVPEAPLSMSAVLLYMWKEMMYVEVSTGNTWRARGQVSAPSKAACTASKTVLCQVSEVTVDGQASDRLKKVLDTNGLAAVHYDALAKTLNMSVLLFDARQDENVTGVQVTSGSSQLYSAGGELFAPSLLQDKGFMLKDHTMGVALDDDNIAALQRGEVKVKVMTSRYPDGIYANIPSLSQMPQPSTANPRSTRGPISRGSHTTTGAAVMTALLVLAKII